MPERTTEARSGCSEPGAWPGDVVESWCPPGSHIFRDEFNARWRVSFSGVSLSRSWALHGYEESAMVCLRTAWLDYERKTGISCWIPGIVPARAAGAAPSGASGSDGPAIAAAEPKPAVARGRGRGRAGAAGRGRGKPAVKAPAKDKSESSDSSDDSSSSSSSS